MIVIQIYSNTASKTMTDKSKTSTTLSFRCPQDMLEAIDSIGREHYPTDKNSKTNSGCDRSKTLFHIIQAGIAAITDGNIQIEVRQQSKTDSKTAIVQGELEELVKKLIGENLPVIQPRLTDDNRYVRRCELDQKIDDRIVRALGEDGLFFDSAANDLTKEAIARSYSQATTNLNSTRDEFYSKVDALQKQFEELKSVPPAAVPGPPIIEQLTTDNEQLTEDVESDRSDSDFKSDTQLPIADDIASLLGIEAILSGDQQYDFNYLNSHIEDRLNEYKSQIEAALKIKLSLSDPKYICREFNKILRAMGLTIENKQIKKVETYWVVPK